MFHVYILYSANYDKYYIGYTDNLIRRLKEHNELSETSYTSKYRPWDLKASFLIGDNRSLALQVEKYIKRQKSRKYLEKLIATQDISYIIDRCNSVG